jgi:hypothetical protein
MATTVVVICVMFVLYIFSCVRGFVRLSRDK